MKKVLLVGGVLAASMLSGCATMGKQQQPTSLQIQSFQTKQFDASKTIAFNSVMSVFQDLGYIIQSANKNTGFITADSPSKNKTSFWDALAHTSASGQTKATAFVENIRPGHTRVRLNFVSTSNLSSAYGQNSERDKPILDPKVYRVAFDKIGNAIFVRQGDQGTGQNASTN